MFSSLIRFVVSGSDRVAVAVRRRRRPVLRKDLDERLLSFLHGISSINQLIN